MTLTSRPQDIGILGLELYFPSEYVNQSDLEKYDGVSSGKYTIGLGQTNMSYVNDREDIYSMSLTVLSNLIKNYNIDVNSIGRLEVGTETLLDKSKSIKSVLMQLFGDNGDIEGIDTINACYGGTNALFNSVNWIESSSWDGRLAIVVCGDIAVYSKGAARPTGGAGTVAMLIGPNAPIVLDSVHGSYMENVYDFYKPDFNSEYPYVQGHFSMSCYIKSVDNCYKNYSRKLIKTYDHNNNLSTDIVGTDYFDYNIFHAPTCKLVLKSYARLLYNDYKANPKLFKEKYPSVNTYDLESLDTISYEDSLLSKPIEKIFLTLSKELINKKVKPSLNIPTNTGNMYTGSVYSALCSALFYIGNDALQNKRIGVFSYGSGLASTLYSIKIKGDLKKIIKTLNLQERLDNRVKKSPEQYTSAIDLREKAYKQKNFQPKGSIDNLVKGTYYLTNIDDMFIRTYAIKD
ncbi:hydroxymethylglutaryl-CoA synthase [Ascoidea rubescens DSM 1968]|uniref:Hydroxymethylglutaryl-CoA synthase n=1 Tax=Ascoidea rubescens DSM 1968 TaxID=1344418 RepID=A0A1D2VET1_9ASCO|nr:synthase, catalyzes the formation of hmg-CoA from acetyl-Co [Ascoidea rubescens DSM 1968]ODV60013.1 synthase, catalyzes the formation of hmg-CoA from acetyl-Co [Ascoidea rubescens DSM 1968]